jgi:transposase
VPADRPLRALDVMLDFERVRTVLADYSSHTGRPSIDPELMLRMLHKRYPHSLSSACTQSAPCRGLRDKRYLWAQHSRN